MLQKCVVKQPIELEKTWYEKLKRICILQKQGGKAERVETPSLFTFSDWTWSFVVCSLVLEASSKWQRFQGLSVGSVSVYVHVYIHTPFLNRQLKPSGFMCCLMWKYSWNNSRKRAIPWCWWTAVVSQVGSVEQGDTIVTHWIGLFHFCWEMIKNKPG